MAVVGSGSFGCEGVSALLLVALLSDDAGSLDEKSHHGLLGEGEEDEGHAGEHEQIQSLDVGDPARENRTA